MSCEKRAHGGPGLGSEPGNGGAGQERFLATSSLQDVLGFLFGPVPHQRGGTGDVCVGGIRVPRGLRLGRLGQPCGLGSHVGHPLCAPVQACPGPQRGPSKPNRAWGQAGSDPGGGFWGAWDRGPPPAGRRDVCHLQSALPLSSGHVFIFWTRWPSGLVCLST